MHIAYKGAAAALNAVLAGEVQLNIGPAANAAPHVKSGRLRALAVTSAQPSALSPELPTVAASGVPGYEVITLYPLVAPAKTPVAIINRLNQEIVRVLNRAETQERFLSAGIETVGNSPQESASIIKAETVKWSKLIKDANIKSD